MSQMSINRRMSKQLVLISYTEIRQRYQKEKKNKTYTTTQMNQRSLMRTIGSQTQKITYYIIPFRLSTRIDKTNL